MWCQFVCMCVCVCVRGGCGRLAVSSLYAEPPQLYIFIFIFSSRNRATCSFKTVTGINRRCLFFGKGKKTHKQTRHTFYLKSSTGSVFHERAVHTGPLRPCLFGRLAGLSGPDGVACQDSELVLHPRAQVYYCSCQAVAPHHLRNWHKTHSGPPSVSNNFVCVWVCVYVCVFTVGESVCAAERPPGWHTWSESTTGTQDTRNPSQGHKLTQQTTTTTQKSHIWRNTLTINIYTIFLYFGTGMSMCTDSKAFWGKFVICENGLYKINWI